MNYEEELEKLIDGTEGIIKTANALDAGISKPAFYNFVKEEQLERISHGIYISPDAWEDALYVLNLRSNQVIFSHETALYLNDLTDCEPVEYSVTVKTGYNPTNLKKDGIKVFTIKKEVYELGMTTKKTSFGHEVRTYNMERTICDCVRSRNNIDNQIFQDSLKRYSKHPEKNIRLLMSYAREFRVDKIVLKYLDILL